MRKLLSICFLLLLLCGCNISPAYEPPKVGVFINGEPAELIPVIEVLNGNTGGIWDSPANELPMLFTSSADTISIVFTDKVPPSVKVKKYNIFDTNDVIGNPNARSAPTDMEAIYQEAAVSFDVVKEDALQQLILVTGEWSSQEVQYAFIVSFESEV